MPTSGFDQDAHKITRPYGSHVIAKSGAAAYEGRDGYKVTPVRGHDDPNGRGFRVTKEG